MVLAFYRSFSIVKPSNGYLLFSPDFYSKKAPQMAAVKAMLDRLAQPRK